LEHLLTQSLLVLEVRLTHLVLIQYLAVSLQLAVVQVGLTVLVMDHQAVQVVVVLILELAVQVLLIKVLLAVMELLVLYTVVAVVAALVQLAQLVQQPLAVMAVMV
jgi:hypothetical protein